MRWGRCDRLAEVLCDFGQEHGRIRRLPGQVDEEVIRGCELCANVCQLEGLQSVQRESRRTFLWRNAESGARGDQFLEHIVLLTIFEQRCDFGLQAGGVWVLLLLDLAYIVGEFLGKFFERAFDQEGVRWPWHPDGQRIPSRLEKGGMVVSSFRLLIE